MEHRPARFAMKCLGMMFFHTGRFDDNTERKQLDIVLVRAVSMTSIDLTLLTCKLRSLVESKMYQKNIVFFTPTGRFDDDNNTKRKPLDKLYSYEQSARNQEQLVLLRSLASNQSIIMIVEVALRRKNLLPQWVGCCLPSPLCVIA